MRHLLALAIAAAALGACAQGGEGGEAAQDAGLNAGTAATADADRLHNEAAGAERARPPGEASGQRWFAKTHKLGPWAGYGRPYSEAGFSVRCEGERLVFNTLEMPPSGPGKTEMRLSADGFSRTLSAEASEEGLPSTSSALPADADWLRELVAASGNLTVTVGGSDPMVVPLAEPLKSLIRDCAA